MQYVGRGPVEYITERATKFPRVPHPSQSSDTVKHRAELSLEAVRSDFMTTVEERHGGKMWARSLTATRQHPDQG